MAKDLLIGIDASTTGCKVVVWDLEGNQVDQGRCEIPMIKPQAEWHEQDAEDIYKALVVSLLKVTRDGSTNRYAGLCICPQRETFIPVDREGKPLRNAILWMDNRGSDWLQNLKKEIGVGNFLNLTGKPPSGNLSLLKMRWLREVEADLFWNSFKFLDIAAYLNFLLTGEFATGWGIADPTGLFDMKTKDWSLEILNYLQIRRDQLPTPFTAGSQIGYITERAAMETGLPQGLPVFAGLGDGQAGGLALNILQLGECYLSLGTSVVSGTYSEEYRTSRNFRTMISGNSEGYSLETVILGGTYTIDWFLGTFGEGYSLKILESEVKHIQPGSNGLILVPYWNSVLNPYWDSKARGIILGWTGNHGPLHLYRAILEGIAFELRLHFEGVEEELGSPIERLVVMGGGSNSDTWCQIIADITGKTLWRSRSTEATALGAAIIGAFGAGVHPSIEIAAKVMSAKPKDVFYPNSHNVHTYTRIYEDVYRDVFPSLQHLVKRLT